MPFESQAQWDWAFATGQPWARDWAKHTPGGKRKYALLKRRASAKRYKHLPGQHNQQAHGRSGRGGGGAGGSKSVAQFNAWNEREIAKIEDIYRTFEDREEYITTPEERKTIARAIRNALVDTKYYKSPPNDQLLDDHINNFIQDSQSLLLTPDEMILIGTNPNIQDALTAGSKMELVEALVRQHYNEQRIRLSNIDAEGQQQILDGIKSKSERTPWDYDTVAGLSIYANPQTRWESIELLVNDPDSRNDRYVSKRFEEFDFTQEDYVADTTGGYSLQNAYDVMKFYSLDYRLYESTVLSSVPESQQLSQFMQKFTYTHSSENTSNVLGAQIQQAVSMIGPNAGGKYPSFYPRGIKPPEPNPEVIRLLNEQYQSTQQLYASAGVTEIALYRGQKPQFAMGIPMGPWSDQRPVAIGFANTGDSRNPGILNSAKMPVQYILMDHTDPNFRTQYATEYEFLITETAFVKNARKKNNGLSRIFGQNFSTEDIYDVTWTEKAFQELPPTSSYLEQDYDIFYNYRTDGKQSARRKRREKAYRYKAEVEARGNAPGRRWSAGSGEVITGNLGRDASGRFVNVGSGSRAVSSAVETIARAQRQNTKKPKKPKKQTLTAEQRAQQRQQERARAGESGMQELGYSKEQYAALATIRGNPQPIGESVDESTQSLIDSGFAEIVGGNVVTTALGKKVLSSVESGSPGDAQEAIIRDQEKRQERADKRQDKIDSLEEKIAGIEDRLDSLKPRSRAVAERRLTRYRAKLAELQTSEKYKHLPNQHDQRAHGRSGRGGGGAGGSKTKPISELTTNELVALLDDPSQYDSESYAASKGGVEIIADLLDSNDWAVTKLCNQIGLDPSDPDTPQIIAGLFSVAKLDNSDVRFDYGPTSDASGETQIRATNADNPNNYLSVTANFSIDDFDNQEILNIDNSRFYNTSTTRGMGYTARRQQILAAQLYKQKTGRNVRINAEAVSAPNGGMNGAHTWPYVGYNFTFNGAFSDYMRDYGFTADDSYTLFKQRNSNGKTGADMYRTMLNDYMSQRQISWFEIPGRMYATEPQGLEGIEIMTEYGRKKYGSTTKEYGIMNINDLDMDDSDIDLLIELWNVKVPNKQPTPTRRKSASGYTPPADVRAAAARGLELRREFNRGGTAVGVARARDLSNGKSVSAQTIRRMVSYFARHAVDKRPDWSNPSNPTPGYIAWMLWGGDAGRRWANAMNKRIKE